ncbi:DUF3179 domain-containing protein [Aggregatimonas sangjinii]|uniref:DUF3179 domain-containing protein n=1 Tax=Aggregatimonas sangjinii TaxID=2583587 RepID=A0A5B7SL23_9FLAO|nr:DUF3179 domain-containing protein [Aggregatimonas sangjinii]QCW98751.1 DUF3179 domain-containing protein [Aggregatimonas sangjinii]
MRNAILLLLVSSTLLCQCSTSSTNSQTVDSNATEWSIPISEVLDGGPGRDGIPALENPSFLTATEATFLVDNDLVIGYKNGDDVRAYPHNILDWHEIVNDNIGDVSLAVTYCPLTGTGIGWNRIIRGQETTFGVSGLLYQTNLMPFDRATESNWSQLLNESVNGSLIGEKIDVITLVETDWKTWKDLYPDTKVVGRDTGFSRTYGTYPYGDYRTNNTSFLFPTPKDDRLPAKDRVHAIIDESNAKVFQFSDFTSTPVIKDTFMGRNYLLVGNENFIMSYALNSSQDALDFEYAFDGNSEVIFSDNEGNSWNIFGEAVAGPREGERLASSTAFMAYWFSIPAFYETEIFGN